MKNIMQLNYWTIGGFDGQKPIEKALDDIREMGLDGIELTFGAGEFSPGITKKRCMEIKKYAEGMGLTIATCATGNYWDVSLAATSAKERKKAVEFTRKYIQATAWVGASVCLVVPGAVFVPWDESKPVIPYKKVWELSTASIRSLLPAARAAGVTIAIENVWNGFLADPVAMKNFVEQFKSKYIGVYFDVANCIINGFPEHWIEILGDKIAAVHIKNFQRQDAGGVLHGFGDDLIKGDVNFGAVALALKKIRYRGPLTAEMIPFSRLPDLSLPDMELARDTAAKMRAIFKKKQSTRK